MASFDIFAATKEGFRYVVNNHNLIIRLAAIPVLVKFISYATVLSLGLEENILRKGLVLFPSYLIEGYLICTLVRLAIFKHESMIQPPGADSHEYYKRRAADIQAGAVVYTLLKMTASLIVGVIHMVEVTPAEESNVQGGLAAFFAAALMVGFLIWAFRILWIYIPVTFGYSMRGYLHRVKGMSFSFHIFSVWIICMLPFALIFLLFSDLMMMMTGHTPESPSEILPYILVGFQSVMEMILLIIVSVAIGYGTIQILTGQNISKDHTKK